MPYMNNLSLVGQLTKEVEIKFLQSGTAMAKGTVFVKEWKKDKEDEFHHFDFVCFGKQAEWLSDAKKSDHVMISGKLQQEKWEKDGQKRSKVSILAEVCRNLDANKSTNTGQNKVDTSSYNDEVTPDDVPF